MLIFVVVLGWHDPAVVKFKKLHPVVRQQDQASREAVSVGQADIENIGARGQAGQSEETIPIGRRRTRSLTVVTNVDYSARIESGIHRIDYAPDQFRGEDGRTVERQQQREA